MKSVFVDFWGHFVFFFFFFFFLVGLEREDLSLWPSASSAAQTRPGAGRWRPRARIWLGLKGFPRVSPRFRRAFGAC